MNQERRYRYYTCDVFTDVRFGGNQLAVLPEATGLSERQMQQIAREFGFSETAFVLPAEAGHTRWVRMRARSNVERLEALAADGATPDVHLYVRSGDEFDIRARMFAPLDQVPEDPATGSANAALGALLATCDAATTESFHWRIAQGVEMGRPSVLEVRTEKRDGIVVETRVGGASVLVSEGLITVD